MDGLNEGCDEAPGRFGRDPQDPLLKTRWERRLMSRSQARDLHPRPGALLGALTLAMLAFSVVQTSTVPILPELAVQFSASTTNIAWMMTGNLLAAAVFTPLLGRIGDLRGRKPMLLVSIAGVLLGSL